MVRPTNSYAKELLRVQEVLLPGTGEDKVPLTETSDARISVPASALIY